MSIVGQAALPAAPMAVEQIKVMVLPDGRVDTNNAAKALNRTTKTLANWRQLGIGPRAFNVGGRVFYRWEDIEAFNRGEYIRPVKQ